MTFRESRNRGAGRGTASGGAAPTDAAYIVGSTHAALSAEVLLSTVLAVGVFAARPAAASVPPGALYSSTDTYEVLRSTGAVWEQFLDFSPAVGRHQLNFVLDNGTDPIGTGVYAGAAIRLPWACTVVRWSLYSGETGSAVVDVLKDTHANFPPVDADRIAGTDKPTLVAGRAATSTALTGWTTSLDAGDVVVLEVESTDLSHLTLALEVTV